MTSISRRSFGKLAAAGLATFATPSLLHAKDAARLVIIGGGFGGASAARFARINFPQIDVTVIEPQKHFVTCPYGNLLLGGTRTLSDITHQYVALKKRGINFIHDWADAIDPDKKLVKLRSGKSVAYDKLIVSPGIGIKWGALPGYDQDAAQIFPHAWVPERGEQVLLLRKQLEALPEGGVVGFSIPANPFRCPPGPYERISLVASYLKKHKPRAKILALDAKDAFSKQGLFQDAWNELYPGLIEWVPGSKDGKVVSVDIKEKVFQTEFGTRHKVDVGNVIPPQSAAKIAVDAGLVNETGFVPVNPFTFEAVKAKDIHVIGDANIGGPLPKSGFIANSTSKQAVASAVALLEGREPPKDPVYFNTCYSHVGDDYGISVVGVFRPSDKGFIETPNSGGVSPRGPLAETKLQRKLEAQYADSWYASITKDAFS
ncbi:cytochrome C [Rhodopseudomonas sp. AAP120]|uniref:NAD(P)/FAD-dependent oxidoreductase n=1 Tax=Rhodopseudomonas sp. AAP120 TaxID=1523430 RepID=UPI0006B9D8C8|nr:NAD(P)/FAD-dependent oxidoreductase [Rhodopseudomonas sp. AAP120]KPG01953.1 cytochrome C [Rhodopseudomonas sp. AAP120]